MTLQSLIVTVVVGGCFVYAAWTLMPQGVRRMLANGLLRLPLPDQLTATLQQALRASGGCNCSGCDQAPAKPAALTQPLRFHPPQREPARRS